MILDFSRNNLKENSEENFTHILKKDFKNYFLLKKLLEIPDCPKEI
jgi:hypothetical protein